MTVLEKAIHNLSFKNTIRFNGKLFKLVCLIRDEDRRPFTAEWWRGKEVYLIAVDEKGCFFMRHSSGMVFRVDPLTKQEEIIAKSINEFIRMIEWDDSTNVVNK